MPFRWGRGTDFFPYWRAIGSVYTTSNLDFACMAVNNEAENIASIVFGLAQ
eukprot:COSAG02_NODE_2605_length_8442_cov_9.552080_9_plen_51_part_00